MKDIQDLPDITLWAHFQRAIDRLESITRLQVQVMGGEPTLWSDWLIERIQERLSKYERYMVFTNGTNRESLWYKDKRAYFLWHITDWDNIRPLKCSDKEQAKIVVTHKNIGKLEEFLTVNMKLNQRNGVTISPCVESGELTATPEDIIRIAELQVKTGSKYPNMVLLAECLKRGDMDNWRKACRRFETTWNVDCQTMKVTPCCGNNVKLDSFRLEDFYGQKQSSCGDCIYAL